MNAYEKRVRENIYCNIININPPEIVVCDIMCICTFVQEGRVKTLLNELNKETVTRASQPTS